MNEEITAPGSAGPGRADATPGPRVTGFSRAVGYSFGQDREARRREKIRQELVHELFARERIGRTQRVTSGPRSLLLKLFKLD